MEDPGVDESIILKRIFKKWGGGHGQLHLFTITEIVVTVLTIVVSKSNAGSSPSCLYEHSLLLAAVVQTVALSVGRDISTD